MVKRIMAFCVSLFTLFTVSGCSFSIDYMQSIVSSVSYPDIFMISYEI